MVHKVNFKEKGLAEMIHVIVALEKSTKDVITQTKFPRCPDHTTSQVENFLSITQYIPTLGQ